MKGDAKNAEMIAGFRSEETGWKKVYDGLEASMKAGFNNEARERIKFFEELTNVKEKIKSMNMGSSCAVSSAASTTSGTDLEGQLDAKENRNQRLGSRSGR